MLYTYITPTTAEVIYIIYIFHYQYQVTVARNKAHTYYAKHQNKNTRL